MPRFLVVDDSRTSRLMLAGELRAAAGGTPEILEAESLDQAVEAFERQRPDLVFLDMMLDLTRTGVPGGSTGLVALDLMLQQRPDARVVLVTALPEDHPDVISAMSMGAYGFVGKPARPDALRKLLSAVEAEAGRGGRIR